jgi:hypothetical protein
VASIGPHCASQRLDNELAVSGGQRIHVPSLVSGWSTAGWRQRSSLQAPETAGMVDKTEPYSRDVDRVFTLALVVADYQLASGLASSMNKQVSHAYIRILI